jgi:hypothetical protein
MFIFRHRSSLILAGLLTALVCLPTSVSAQLPACEPATNPGIQPTFPQDSAQDALSEDNTQNNAYTDTRYGSIGDITYLKPIEQQNALKNIEAINPTGVFNTYDTQSLRGSVHGPGDPDPNNPQLPGNIFSALNVNAAYKDSMWRDGQQATTSPNAPFTCWARSSSRWAFWRVDRAKPALLQGSAFSPQLR